MKTLSLFVSVIVFFVSGFFFNNDFRESTETNYLIYMSLLVLLMLISVIGMIVNFSLIIQQRNKIQDFFQKLHLAGRN
jgi:Flp pilus assembly protein TadG